jgi:hypothetical protein
MRQFLIMLFAAFASATIGCSNFGGHKPDPTRQAWRDSWDALSEAKAANPEGLRRSFQAAHDQVMMPYVNGGEDASAIKVNLHTILTNIGDLRFSEALLLERPEIRSAVRECMYESEVKLNFPKTHEILRTAPNITWPSDIAYEQSYTSVGQTAPPKRFWRP